MCHFTTTARETWISVLLVYLNASFDTVTFNWHFKHKHARIDTQLSSTSAFLPFRYY